MQVLENTVGDLLGYVCQQAVNDPSPFEPWPSDMRRMGAVKIIRISCSRFIIIEMRRALRLEKKIMDLLIYIFARADLDCRSGLHHRTRAFALRWNKVVPPAITTALAACKTRDDVDQLRGVCAQKQSPLGRLLLLASQPGIDWPKRDNVDAVQTAARHELVRLERGLVVLEIIVGIAPLLGLVGTIFRMITVFGDVGQSGAGDAAKLAQGIALILRATLIGLLIAIPSLIAWSYFSKKVEVFAVEMEALCDDFIRRKQPP